MRLAERMRIALRDWLAKKSRAEEDAWINHASVIRTRELAQFHAWLATLPATERKIAVEKHLKWVAGLNADPCVQSDREGRMWLGMLNADAQALGADIEPEVTG